MATAEYENDNDVSVQMHEAVLPRRLPVLPCFDVGAAYLLASTATGAGSDWFDVVPAANGAVVVVVGDVAGRGVDAVATMSQLRTSLREHLRVGHDLLSALEATNSLAADLDGGTAATVCVASFEPGPGKVVYCTAGHPAPLVVGLDGTASHLPPTGAGALATGGTFAFGEHRLQPGELFVLYTDGVLQTHAGPVHDRLDAVARSVAAAFAAGGGGHGIRGCVDLVCERVLTTVASIGALHDDAAVVAVEPMPQHRALELELTAGPTTSETARAALDEWLHELCVRELDEVATLHALGELVANAAEHAYWDRHPPAAGAVSVRATLEPSGEVQLVVRDRGRWRPRGARGRGRGLRMARALADHLRIEAGRHGTQVTSRHLVGRAVPIARGRRPALVEGARACTTGEEAGRITVHGSVHETTVDHLRHALLRFSNGGTESIVVDLSGVTFLGSAGVQLLVEVRSWAGGEVVVDLVAAPGCTAQHVLETVGLPYLMGERVGHAERITVDDGCTGGTRSPTPQEAVMATGETGFDDVTFDLISVQYHSLKAGHDYGQYVRDAENAGQDEIAAFFREVMDEDSRRAHRCHELLGKLGPGTDNTAPTSGAG